MDSDLVTRLTAAEGRALLAALPPYDEATALALQTRLRDAGHDPDLVSAALAQARLRARGRARLGDVVDRLLLTSDGLEQATRPAVAALHAAGFTRAGVETVDDLGCGLGLDSLAFLAEGLGVRGVEADPVVAAMALANLTSAPGSAPRAVVNAALEEVAAQPAQDRIGRGAWFDPARRRAGQADVHGRTRRVGSPQQTSPPWEVVQEVARRYPAAGAKLAPSFRPAMLPEGCEGVWTSVGRTMVECAVWWGDAVQVPGVCAVLLPAEAGPGEAGVTVRPGDGAALSSAAPVGDGSDAESLWEPDPAVLQAGLIAEVEQATGGREVGAGVGYVVGPGARELPWARRYRVEDRLPLSVKVLRRYIRDQGWNALVLKARGTRADPEALRRDLRPDRGRGPLREGTLVVTTEAGKSVVLAVTPTTSGAQGR